MGNIDFAYLYTSTDGRIGRKNYWIGIVGFIVAWLIIYLVIALLFGVVSTIGMAVLFILQLVLLYPTYALMGKRFQDRNKPASLALIGIGLGILYSVLNLFGLTMDAIGQPTWLGWIFSIAFLIVGIWYLIELGFLRGTVGTNDYGPDPLAVQARM